MKQTTFCKTAFFVSLPCLWGQEFAYINGKNVATGRCSGRFHLQTSCSQKQPGENICNNHFDKRLMKWIPLPITIVGLCTTDFVATNWWCTAKVLAGVIGRGIEMMDCVGVVLAKVDFHNLISDSAPNYIGDVTLKKILKEHPTTSTTNLFGSHYNFMTRPRNVIMS